MKKFRWILFSLLTLVVPFGSSIQATSSTSSDSEFEDDLWPVWPDWDISPDLLPPEERPSQKEVGHRINRFYNRITGDHLYSDSFNEEINPIIEDISQNRKNSIWVPEVGWFSPPTGDPVYRVYNANSGEHFYTASLNEREALIKAGWKDEGLAFHSNTPDKDPVYRLFNPNATNAGSHHFTYFIEEVEALTRLGWKNEGIVWYVTNYPDPYFGAAN